MCISFKILGEVILGLWFVAAASLAFSPTAFPESTSPTTSTENARPCIYFDFKKMSNLTLNKGALKQYRDCWNETMPNFTRKDIRNFTNPVYFDCLNKCVWLSYSPNVLTIEGKIDGDSIRRYYETFTNATGDSISGFISFYEHCKNDADKEITELKSNGSTIHSCKFYGLFGNCVYTQYTKFYKSLPADAQALFNFRACRMHRKN